jgi:hypothetical protein
VRESGTVAFDLSIWTDHKSWAPAVVIWRGSDENNYSLAAAAEIHAAGIPLADITDATLRAEVESLRTSRQSDARKVELAAGLDDGSYVAEPVGGWPVGQSDASLPPADLAAYESDPLGSESLVEAGGVASNGSSVGDTQTALGAVDGTQGQSDASGQPEEEFYVVEPETEQTRDALVALCEDQCMKGGGQSVRTTIYRIARALMDRLDIERGAARRAVPVWPCLKCLATIPVSEGQRCSSCRTSARSPSGKAAEGENVDRDVLKVGDIQFAPIVKECALADALEREAVDANYDSPTDLMQRIARISRATL